MNIIQEDKEPMSTKFCYECGAEKVWGHKFCGSCGKSFQMQSKVNFVQNKKEINTYNQHQIYLNKIYNFESKFFSYMFFIIFLSIVLMVLMGFTIGFRFFSISLGSIFFLFFSFFIFKFLELDSALARVIYGRDYEHKRKSLSAVYESLDSSKNNKGETVCIFCGNSRFFRKGIYATSSCTVNCTKCQAYLFTE